MRRLARVSMLSLLLALPVAAAAQSFMQAAEIPPEMSQLDFLVGRWLGEGKIYDPEGNVTHEISMAEMGMGPIHVEPILGGLVLEVGAGSDFARTWYTYRPLEEEFVWVAVDRQGHFDHLRGNFEDGRLVLTEIRPQAWRDGGTMMFRRTYQDIEEDSHEVLMEYSRDEGRTWVLFSSQIEHRVKDEAAAAPRDEASARLDVFVGTWEAKGVVHMPDGDVESSGTSTYRWRTGGVWLEEELVGEVPTMGTIHGATLMSYDKATGDYSGVWLDSLTPRTYPFRARWSGPNELIFESEFDEPSRMKLRYNFKSEDLIEIVHFRQVGDQPEKEASRIEMRRVVR